MESSDPQYRITSHHESYLSHYLLVGDTINSHMSDKGIQITFDSRPSCQADWLKFTETFYKPMLAKVNLVEGIRKKKTVEHFEYFFSIDEATERYKSFLQLDTIKKPPLRTESMFLPDTRNMSLRASRDSDDGLALFGLTQEKSESRTFSGMSSKKENLLRGLKQSSTTLASRMQQKNSPGSSFDNLAKVEDVPKLDQTQSADAIKQKKNVFSITVSKPNPEELMKLSQEAEKEV